VRISTSIKHQHPVKEHATVIDWTFSSDWFEQGTQPFVINLRDSLDYVYLDFCKQFTGAVFNHKFTIELLAEKSKQLKELENEIANLKQDIKRTAQFNEKVELNLQLKEAENRLIEFKLAQEGSSYNG
jgi:hypothetical protein